MALIERATRVSSEKNRMDCYRTISIKKKKTSKLSEQYGECKFHVLYVPFNPCATDYNLTEKLIARLLATVAVSIKQCIFI